MPCKIWAEKFNTVTTCSNHIQQDGHDHNFLVLTRKITQCQSEEIQPSAGRDNYDSFKLA